MEIAPRVTVSPEVRFGKPVMKGTRVPVATVLERLSSGMSFEEVEEEYGLSRDDILAALAYAAKVVALEE